ncbi:hypothetical protein AHF37_10795 [Paragonimus kellicotti]|nr:hypothetical protein AHF37_10795 [Paragonimus kellicotti]
MGLFPKARVVRGIDWSWDSQDCVSPLTSSGTGSLLLGTSGSVLSGRGLLRSSVDQVSAGPILLPIKVELRIVGTGIRGHQGRLP